MGTTTTTGTTMTAAAIDECEHGDITMNCPVDGCDHHVDAPDTDDTDDTDDGFDWGRAVTGPPGRPPLIARFRSTCPECRDPIYVGDKITETDTGFVHYDWCSDE